MNVTIEKIEIVSFGKLKNSVVSMDSGINVLSAPNESGKSTLASFIKFVFYGYVGAKKAFPQNERKLFTPWDSEISEGTLTIIADGTRYDINRKCLPSGKETVEIVNRITGKPEFKGEVPGEVFFGVAEEVFARTLFFRQLALPENKDEILAERLRNIALGADEEVGTAKALRRLNDAKKEIKSRVGGGIIPKLEKERDRLEQTVTDCSDIRREVARLQTEINNRSQKIASGEEKLMNLEAERKNIEKYEAFLKLQNIKRLADEEERAKKEYLELQKRFDNQEEPNIPLLNSKNNEFVFENRNLKLRISELKNAEEALSELENAELIVPEKEKKGKLHLLFFVFALISAVAGVFLPIMFIAAAVFAVVGTVLAISANKNSKSVSDEQKALKADLDSRKSVAKERVDQLKSEIENSSSLAEELGEGLYKSISRFIKTEKLGDYSEVINDLQNALFETEKKKVVWETKNDELASTTRNLDMERISELAKDAKKPERDRTAVERELKFYGQQQDQLLALNRRDELDCAAFEAKSGDIALLLGKRNSLNERISDLYIKHKAYETAMTFIEESADHMKSMVAPRIGSRANVYFSAATDGKYNSFEVDTSLSMSFGEDFRRSCEYLSAGTRDSAYLSLRLALADILFGGNGVPIILDDAFVRMDENRLGSMMNALDEAAKNHQIIILTHGNREINSLSEKGISYKEISIKNG